MFVLLGSGTLLSVHRYMTILNTQTNINVIALDEVVNMEGTKNVNCYDVTTTTPTYVYPDETATGESRKHTSQHKWKRRSVIIGGVVLAGSVAVVIGLIIYLTLPNTNGKEALAVENIYRPIYVG